ncbi:MAG TPA: phosphoribosylformylglycinamidine synthase subunit PurS [Candidatus Krumholzibacteria bacterium]|jgi:phosphoribosylformylglycinamidine synthase
MNIKARVYVTLKKSVFDPQGKTIADALLSVGYAGVADVRQGKFFDVSLEADSPEAARASLEEMAHKVLANPVIESYEIEVDG